MKLPGLPDVYKRQVEVSFDEAAFGCDKLISLQNADGMGGLAQSLQVHILSLIHI